jgi:2-oxoglutarate dehydrogenase E2 component (dihydrolipoamide succinyltransferase)
MHAATVFALATVLLKHGVKLGFVSAFIKAASSGLTKLPAVNGAIGNNEIIYRYAQVLSSCCRQHKICSPLVLCSQSHGELHAVSV